MSFYWQQALPKDDNPTPQQSNGSNQWDDVNLAPNNNYGHYAQQSNGYAQNGNVDPYGAAAFGYENVVNYGSANNAQTASKQSDYTQVMPKQQPQTQHTPLLKSNKGRNKKKEEEETSGVAQSSGEGQSQQQQDLSQQQQPQGWSQQQQAHQSVDQQQQQHWGQQDWSQQQQQPVVYQQQDWDHQGHWNQHHQQQQQLAEQQQQAWNQQQHDAQLQYQSQQQQHQLSVEPVDQQQQQQQQDWNQQGWQEESTSQQQQQEPVVYQQQDSWSQQQDWNQPLQDAQLQDQSQQQQPVDQQQQHQAWNQQQQHSVEPLDQQQQDWDQQDFQQQQHLALQSQEPSPNPFPDTTPSYPIVASTPPLEPTTPLDVVDNDFIFTDSQSSQQQQQQQQGRVSVDSNQEDSANSSQVTPDSTYSVDTFASNDNLPPTSHVEVKNDEFDDWEQTDGAETLHETTPSDVSQTQSEPPKFSNGVTTDESRASSMAPGSDHHSTMTPASSESIHNNRFEEDRSVESQPPVVAQIAPIQKKQSVEPSPSPVNDQPIARVEPVAQQVDTHTTNIQRVAPTRPLQSANVEQIPPAETTTVASTVLDVPPIASSSVENTRQPDITTTSASTSSANTVLTAPSLQDVRQVDVHEQQQQQQQVVEQQQQREAPTGNSESSLSVPQNNPVEQARTPEPVMGSGAGSSPGEAQATSTPISEQEPPVTRNIAARRDSTSSIRSAILSQLPSIAPGEASDNSQSSFVRSSLRGSYHERYRGVKEKYLDSVNNVPRVIERLDRHRMDVPKIKKNPLVDLSMGGRRSVVTISNTNNRADNSIDSSMAYKDDKLNMSLYSQPDPSLDRSVDMSRGYGEDFVNASRRSRLARNRPPSRAKSEVGDMLPPHLAPQGRASVYDYGNQMHQPYYHGYHTMGPHNGRRSAVPYPQDYYQQQQQQRMHYDYRRPQSTVDPRAMQRFQREGGNLSSYDAFNKKDYEKEEDEYSSVSAEDEEEDGDSEEEMRRYNQQGPAHHHPAAYGYPTGPPPPHQMNMLYNRELNQYFGKLNLTTQTIDSVFHRTPPPKEYYTLLTSPHEQAAYLYYAAVYKKLFPSVRDFQVKFNKNYYSFMDEGLSHIDALCKICKSMYDEYHLIRMTSQQKAYEASQKQLFSDDRDSADGVSDRASVDDKDEVDKASDIMSIDISSRAPLKFRSPHSFVTFGPGGKMVTVDPSVAVSVVQIDDVKRVLRDNETKRLIDAAQIFGGPLVDGNTPAHSIRLYIQRQIEKIRTSEVAMENPKDNDVIDCLLIWQLLEMVVQQKGRVSGPDIASLLIAAGSSSSRQLHPHHREKSATPVEGFQGRRSPSLTGDGRAFERFTQFVVGGHVKEAIESALRDGLYADAMVLARKIYPADETKISEIEARFLSTRPNSSPVLTMLAVAGGQPAPILTNPPVDDTGSWRAHAASVLANLNSSHAMETVYKLGLVLAKREYHSAADFCLLAVSLLTDFNVFHPSVNAEDSSIRQHITLIHSTLPDDEWNSTVCKYGFSLTDLHATEIFDYAIRQQSGRSQQSHLQNSLAFQRKRLQYAKLLAGFGGFTSDSFRFCLSVASSIWNYYSMFSAAELTELADLADSLRYLSAADTSETGWIETLRGCIAQMPQSSSLAAQATEPVQPIQTADINTQQFNQLAHVEPVHPPEVSSSSTGGQDHGSTHDHEVNVGSRLTSIPEQPSPRERLQSVSSTRSRSESLVMEANDWHGSRQDPIQIKSHADPSSDNQHHDDPSSQQQQQDYRGSYDNSHQTGHDTTYGEQLCQTQNQVYQPPQPNYQQKQQYGYEDSSETTTGTSDNTTTPSDSSTESTPVRQLPQRPPQQATAQQNYAPPPQPPQQQQQQQYVPPPRPAQQQQQPPPQSSAQQQPPAQQQQASKAPGDQKQQAAKKKSGSGFLGKLINKVIPTENAMILPDDKSPEIKWDPVLNKWVGSGVEEEVAPAPPPAMDTPNMSTNSLQGGGLRAARGSGGSRYFNALSASASTNGGGMMPEVPVAAPSMPIPTSFGFMPTMPDDAESVDPFSGQANPTVHGMDPNPEPK